MSTGDGITNTAALVSNLLASPASGDGLNFSYIKLNWFTRFQSISFPSEWGHRKEGNSERYG